MECFECHLGSWFSNTLSSNGSHCRPRLNTGTHKLVYTRRKELLQLGLSDPLNLVEDCSNDSIGTRQSCDNRDTETRMGVPLGIASSIGLGSSPISLHLSAPLLAHTSIIELSMFTPTQYNYGQRKEHTNSVKCTHACHYLVAAHLCIRACMDNGIIKHTV